jgi:hypothetical protein
MFTEFLKGYAWAHIGVPVEAYVVYRFGGALWQDIKVLAYSAWDKVKPAVKVA